MKAPDPQLNAREFMAAHLLAQGVARNAVAKACRMSRSTLWKRLKEPTFRSVVHDLRQADLEQLGGLLLDARRDAVLELQKIVLGKLKLQKWNSRRRRTVFVPPTIEDRIAAARVLLVGNGRGPDGPEPLPPGSTVLGQAEATRELVWTEAVLVEKVERVVQLAGRAVTEERSLSASTSAGSGDSGEHGEGPAPEGPTPGVFGGVPGLPDSGLDDP